MQPNQNLSDQMKVRREWPVRVVREAFSVAATVAGGDAEHVLGQLEELQEKTRWQFVTFTSHSFIDLEATADVPEWTMDRYEPPHTRGWRQAPESSIVTTIRPLRDIERIDLSSPTSFNTTGQDNGPRFFSGAWKVHFRDGASIDLPEMSAWGAADPREDLQGSFVEALVRRWNEVK